MAGEAEADGAKVKWLGRRGITGPTAGSGHIWTEKEVKGMAKKKRKKKAPTKKGTYYYETIDSGQRKRFKKGDFPSYEPSSSGYDDLL